ncbi:MAG: prepilin-type N-terminal cleavage/methylation domain-containing protein [Fibrobacterota bacterium]|nr:prepilin-type N-terminal cleavage/methylation domain-containing protein [Fibrobacterota bacterium]QQS04043.1 MAG: prepilin-type N-terminal cleavage/methylation domain-containing protein [Fibrobacterota bacterium]
MRRSLNGIRHLRGGGYTLIEVLIAMVILVAIYPAISTLVSGSRKAQVSGFRMEQASSLAETTIDSLASLPSGAWATGSSQRVIAGVVYTASWTRPAGVAPWIFPVTITWIQGSLQHSVSLPAVLR